jgi:hypothetical protein
MCNFTIVGVGLKAEVVRVGIVVEIMVLPI